MAKMSIEESLELDRNNLRQYINNESEVELLLQIKYGLSPEQFEHRVAQYYRDVKWYETVVQWGYDDEWIDVIAQKSWSPTLYIQCKKRILWHITLKDIWYFYGLVTDKVDNNIEMVYVTTTWVTPNAKKFAKSKNIIIKNYRDIIEMALEMKLDINVLGGKDIWYQYDQISHQEVLTLSDSTEISDWTGPQIENTKKEVSYLTDIIAREKVNLQTLQQELYVFKLEYQSIIAPYYLRKLSIDKEITQYSKKNKVNEDIIKESDYEPEKIDDELFNETNSYYESQKIEYSKIQDKENKLSEDQKHDIKKIYRQLMMRFHPDKFANKPELIELAQNLAQQINEAYEIFDLQKLLEIEKKYENWLSNEDAPYIEITLDDLINRKQRLENEILEIQDKYKSISSTELYEMYKEYLSCIKNGKDFFRKLINEIKKRFLLQKVYWLS